jgi:hypothetical protein
VTRQADPAAAVALRVELARSRSEGIRWSNELFDSAVRRALVGQSWQDKSDWRVAFRQTRSTWRKAYLGKLDVTVRLDAALLEWDEDDEPMPERRFVLIA